MTNKLVPEIRFEGFYGEWENCKLGSISEKISVGIATSSSQFFSDAINGVPFIRNHNIKENSLETNELEYISEEFDKKNKNKRVKTGDILTARTGYPGLSAVVPSKLNGAQTFTTLITRINKDIASPYFISSYINSPIGMRQINGMEAGGAQKNVNASILKEMKLNLPSVNEQVKIYAFIEAFNKIIALQQRHVEQLKQSKQGFLQKMFPKGDELVPEIRFDGFSGKWKRKILSQVLSPGNKLAVSDTSAYKRITVKLNKRGVEEAKSDRKLADTRPFYQRYSGELIIGKQNYFNGSIAIVPKDFDGYICSNAIMSFSVVNDDLYFVYSQISQSDYICRHSHIADGTGQKELSEKKFLKFAVLIPELAEQQKIGEFFKQLDDLIAKNERELELLQETKKGFLQKMFV